MKKSIKFFQLLSLMLFSIAMFAQSGSTPGERPQPFSRFFNQNLIPKVTQTKTLSKKSRDHSDELQRLINKSKGVLIITGPKVIRINNITLKSNFHLKFSPDITLELPASQNEKGGTMFTAGKKGFIKNFAVTSTIEDGNNDDTNTWFTADIGKGAIPDDNNRVFMTLSHVKNFKVAGVNIIDNVTRISCFTMGASSKAKGDQRLNVPRNGIIMNTEMLGKGNGGYGLVQTQGAINVLFYNVTARGGAVIRLESGGPQVSIDRAGGPEGNVITLDDVFIRKAKTIDGNVAIAMSPHRIHQGTIDIDDLTAESTSLAVHVGRGFRDTNVAKKPGDKNIEQRGSFNKNSIISNITVIGGKNAKYGIKARNFLSCEEVANATPGDELRTIRSRALAAVEYVALAKSLGGLCPEGTKKKDGGCYTVQLPDPSDIKVINPDDVIYADKPIIYGDEKRSKTNKDGSCCNVGQPCKKVKDGPTYESCTKKCAEYFNATSGKQYRKCRQICKINPKHEPSSLDK